MGNVVSRLDAKNGRSFVGASRVHKYFGGKMHHHLLAQPKPSIRKLKKTAELRADTVL